jgi:hypothetical protein
MSSRYFDSFALSVVGDWIKRRTIKVDIDGKHIQDPAQNMPHVKSNISQI